MPAFLTTEVAVINVGTMITPNQPRYRRLLVEVMKEARDSHLEYPVEELIQIETVTNTQMIEEQIAIVPIRVLTNRDIYLAATYVNAKYPIGTVVTSPRWSSRKCIYTICARASCVSLALLSQGDSVRQWRCGSMLSRYSGRSMHSPSFLQRWRSCSWAHYFPGLC